jgi:tetratricopeptide (TPR) repeat protein
VKLRPFSSSFLRLRALAVCAVASALILSATFGAAQQSSAALAQELQARVAYAANAERTGNPYGIAETNKRVVAIALRQIAQLRLGQGVPGAAAEIFKESLAIEDNTDARFGMALALTRANRFDEALKEALKVTELEPRNAAAWNLAGKVAMAKKDYKVASDCLAKSVALQPDMEVAYTLASAYLQQKKTDDAALVFQKMAQVSGDVAKMHIMAGRAFEQAGFPDKAEQQYLEAIKTDAKVSRGHYFHGLFLLVKNGWETTPQSREEFLKEVQVNPKDFYGNYFTGYILSTEKNYEESDKYLKVAAEANPDWPEPFLYLGLNAYGAGNNAAAEQYLRKAIKLTGSEEDRNDYQVRRAYFTLGRILISKGEREEGLRYSQRSKEMEAKLVVNVRQQALANGQAAAGSVSPGTAAPLPQAQPEVSPIAAAAPLDEKTLKGVDMTDSEKMMALNAEQKLREILGVAFMNIGSGMARMHEFPLAVSYFHDAERWNPQADGLMRNLGMAAFLSGNYSECVRALKAEQRPLDPSLQSMLALSLYLNNRYAEAVKAFEPVEDAAAVDPRMAYAYAESLAKTNEKQRAAGVLDKISAQNVAPESLVMFGKLYAEIGDKAKADACYAKAKLANPQLSLPK